MIVKYEFLENEKGKFMILIFLFTISSSTGNIAWANNSDSEYENLNEKFPWLFEQLDDFDAIVLPHDSEKDYNTRPTFGLDHTNNQKIIDSGFKMNNMTFSITDNFYTPFQEQTVNIGEKNTFEAKIYAQKGLKVQEFLFGIPKVGEAHIAEVGVEVWFDYTGEIQQVKVIQKSNVVDEKSIVAEHEKIKCLSFSAEEKCDLVKISVTFLEPLKDKVMALKAIDYKNRYQITYLNEGIFIAGDSQNPMQSEMIPSETKGQGLIQVTQTAKYSPYWVSNDGRLYERNDFGSFKQINQKFERFHDVGTAYTRLHSEFGKIIAYEQNRANQIFDSSKLVNELPDSFAYDYPDHHKRITTQLTENMSKQEEIAKKTLEETQRNTRW